MEQQEIVKLIKQKKELSGLADSVVISTLEEYLSKTKIDISNISAQESKIIVKEIRAKLRRLSGQYQKSLKREKSLTNQQDITDILKTHSSTSERLAFYPELIKIIKTLNAKSILDLGCGLNPLALANKKIKYFASDIKEDELNIIQSFFSQNKISGNTFVCDLRNPLNNLPKADLCLMFKVIDVVDPASKKRGKITEEILKQISCKNIIISFATKKLSGKKMNFPERFWFEEILYKLNYPFKKFSSENEIFYIIEKLSPNK